MMTRIPRFMLMTAALGALSACNPGAMDWDLRGLTGGALTTADAARGATDSRPRPDDRGVIAYPGYQVAVARRGDTVGSLASRLGLTADELGRYNALKPDDVLRQGEIVALPSRVAAAPVMGSAPQSGAIVGGTIAPVAVTAIATTALDRVGNSSPRAAAPATATRTTATRTTTAEQPGRHRVKRGETAYSVARSYGISVKALADWNGLGPNLDLREGQYLLIPTASAAAPAPSGVNAPGTASATPVPPSAARPLPEERTVPVATALKNTPTSPNLGATRTAASASAFVMPADGKIIRPFVKGKTLGIDIGAAAGSTVRATAAGEVASVTIDTAQTPIILIRHAGNLISIYAGVAGIKVKKGDKVQRGQAIAVVQNANPAFLHFEIRKGSEPIDPMTFLQ